MIIKIFIALLVFVALLTGAFFLNSQISSGSISEGWGLLVGLLAIAFLKIVREQVQVRWGISPKD